MGTSQLLSGVRIIESSLLGPGLISTFFSDLGADVIKVEPPQGDYIRQMTWPIIDGVSLLHLHTHRGKRSIALNLKTDDGLNSCLLYTSPSPRDRSLSRMPSSA